MTCSYYNHCHLSNGWRTSWDDWSSRLWIKMESLPSTASLSSPGSLSPFKEFLGLVLVNEVSGSEAVGERTVWHPLSKQKNCSVVCAGKTLVWNLSSTLSPALSLLCPFYCRSTQLPFWKSESSIWLSTEVGTSVSFSHPKATHLGPHNLPALLRATRRSWMLGHWDPPAHCSGKEQSSSRVGAPRSHNLLHSLVGVPPGTAEGW